MSLNAEERRRTSDELTDNYSRAGLTPADVERDLGLTPDELTATLGMRRSVDPVTVWRLRDHLESAVLRAGGRPRPYTCLTEDMRSAARGWFGIPARRRDARS